MMGEIRAESSSIIWSSEYTMASKPPKKVSKRCSLPDKPAQEVRELANDLSESLVDCSRWPATATSVMLRNIPNRYTQENLLEELTDKGFHETFDYFHLVMDMKSKRNKGFAFLNMHTPELARKIHSEFHNIHLRYYNSKKVVEVALAEIQGFEANVLGYLNAHGDRVQNVWFRPMIFKRHPWKAIPLKEENLPQKLAQMYREFASKGSGQATADVQNDLGWNKDEPLQDGEYDEIHNQVQRFLQDGCESAETDSDHEEPRSALASETVLSILEKPRRKRKAQKQTKQMIDGIECSSSGLARVPARTGGTTASDQSRCIANPSSFAHFQSPSQLSSEPRDLQAPWVVDVTPNIDYYTCGLSNAPLLREVAAMGDSVFNLPSLLSSPQPYAKLPMKHSMPPGLSYNPCYASVNPFTETLLATNSPLVSSTQDQYGLFANALHGGIRPPPGLSL